MVDSIDELCFWKSVELRDKAKDYKGTTFSENAKCASCAGYNKSCSEYMEKPKAEEPNGKT